MSTRQKRPPIRTGNQSESPPQRVALLVLGMHRSGTSAVSGTLARLGVSPPKTLLEGQQDNLRGHWESAPLAAFHDELLASAGSRWDDWRAFDEGWYRTPVALEFKQRAKTLLKQEFADSTMFVFKDPRLCRFLRFWLEIFEEEGIEPRVLIPVRSPIEVAQSHRARDGFSLRRGLLLWLRHVLDAEEVTRGLSRSIFLWDDFLGDWQGTIRRVENDIRMPFPAFSDYTELAVEKFISDDLRHERVSDEEFAQHVMLNDWTRDAFFRLRELAVNNRSNSALTALDEIRRDFNHATSIFGGVVAEFEIKLQDMDVTLYAERERKINTEQMLQLEQENANILIRNLESKHISELAQYREEMVAIQRILVGEQQKAEELFEALTKTEERLQLEQEKLTHLGAQLSNAEEALQDEKRERIASDEARTSARLEEIRRSDEFWQKEKAAFELAIRHEVEQRDNAHRDVVNLRAKLQGCEERLSQVLQSHAAEVKKLEQNLESAALRIEVSAKAQERQQEEQQSERQQYEEAISRLRRLHEVEAAELREMLRRTEIEIENAHEARSADQVAILTLQSEIDSAAASAAILKQELSTATLRVEKLTVAEQRSVATKELMRSVLREAHERQQAVQSDLDRIKSSRSWRYTKLMRKTVTALRLPPSEAIRLALTKLRFALAEGKRRSDSLDEFFETGCLIVTPGHTLGLANKYAEALRALGFVVKVESDLKNQHHYQHLFVFCANIYSNIRDRFFAVQMEQAASTRWFTTDYLNKLRSAEAIIDYSSENIAFLKELGIPLSKIYFVPVSSGGDENIRPIAERDIDVLFYGDISCERRRFMLEKLSSQFNIRIETDAFGDDIVQLLRRAKVVVNIHYYESALLETVRLTECLSYGARVVSEQATDKDAMQKFTPAVEFVRVGDYIGMAEKIKTLLEEKTWIGKAENIKSCLKEIDREFNYYFRRSLWAHNMIGLADLMDVSALPQDTEQDQSRGELCLTLAETPERSEQFRRKPDGACFTFFPGLRHRVGWIGCAMSYKAMAQAAMSKKLTRLTICEDDVEFYPDYQDRKAVSLEYLGLKSGEWDVFSGFMADVSAETKITKIEVYKGVKFIWMDRMISMVYNVFSQHAITQMAQWNPEDNDVQRNTIDRYLQSRKMRVVVAYPFLVGHDDSMYSTLWGFKNTSYNDLVARTHLTLSMLIDQFEQGRN